MNYSYVMGGNDSIYNLEEAGFIIHKNKRNNYEVEFPKEKNRLWEEYITKNLEIGYWNEYITTETVVFLFHLETGIKKYIVKNYENDEVLKLCEKLCDCKFESIHQMLNDNDFYKEKVFRNE